MRYTFCTPLTIEQCKQRLRNEVDDNSISATKPYRGIIGEQKIQLRYSNPHGRNSFSSWFFGEFQRNSEFGTVLIGSFKTHLVVRIFSTIWISLVLFGISLSVFGALERLYFSPSKTFDLPFSEWFFPIIGIVFIILMRFSGQEDEVLIADFLRETLSVSNIDKAYSFIPSKDTLISAGVILTFVTFGAYLGYFAPSANGNENISTDIKVSKFFITTKIATESLESLEATKTLNESTRDIYACGYLTTSQPTYIGVYWYKDSMWFPYSRNTHIKVKTGVFCVRLVSPSYETGHYTVRVAQLGDTLSEYNFDILP